MPSKAESEIVDVDVQMKIGDREKAYLVVSLTTGKEAWVPKSLAEFELHARISGIGTLTLPRWLAEDKELI